MENININTDKTKSVIISKRTRVKLPNLNLHNASIEYVQNYCYLGVILNHRMNWWKRCEGPAVLYDIETTTEVVAFCKVKIRAL